jgi:hypothetical protein
VTRIVWLAVACLAIALVWRLAPGPPPVDVQSFEDFWPSVGQHLSASELRRAFGDPPGWNVGPGLSWFLVVTPECPWCLALDAELAELARVGACTDTPTNTLVINPGGRGTDSLAAVLTKHGMRIDGMADGDGFQVLGLRAVPLVIEVDSNLVVQRAFRPGDSDLGAEGCDIASLP